MDTIAFEFAILVIAWLIIAGIAFLIFGIYNGRKKKAEAQA